MSKKLFRTYKRLIFPDRMLLFVTGIAIPPGFGYIQPQSDNEYYL